MRIAFASVTFALLATTAQAQALGEPKFLGQFVLPTGLKVDGVAFGGISGLDYDAENDVYYAISDDRAQNGPARFYELKLAIDEEGVHGVDVVATHTLLDLEGKPFAEKDIDPEAIRYDATRKSIFWSSEGDLDGKPAIYEADMTGKAVRAFAVPETYMPNKDGTSGVRGNLAFESLAISADGKMLYAGTENGLAQDGGKATLEEGSFSRIIGFDIESGEPVHEYVYMTNPIHAKATAEPSYNDNGLSDFMSLGDAQLLTVERSFGSGIGNQISLYVTDFSAATDVNGIFTISDAEFGAAEKELWLKIAEGDNGVDIDNIEAVTFGPQLGGKRTLVLASDNNFNPIGQFTQFVVYTLGE